MSNDLYDTVNPDHLIDCDPDRMVDGQPFGNAVDGYIAREPMSFRALVRRAVAFGWGEGDDNDGNEWCADVLAAYVPDMTPHEVVAIMYVIANASRDGAWDNMAHKVTA